MESGFTFSELLAEKISARQAAGETPNARAQRVLNQRARDRFFPLVAAVSSLHARLSAEPLYVSGFGSDQMDVKGSVSDDGDIQVELSYSGAAGSYRFHSRNSFGLAAKREVLVAFSILPDLEIALCLRCRLTYGESRPVNLSDDTLPSLIMEAEDMISDYLADVFVSQLGERLFGETDS